MSDRASYPPPPWRMVGQLWLSLFGMREGVDAQRPAGVYAAAFVSYEPGSSLCYSELLVARTVRTPADGRCVTITDIWVDSPASMAGGRGLWAIPKGLSDFDLDSLRRGPVSSTDWRATSRRRPIAAASFTDTSRAMFRAPFRGRTWQPGIAETDGEDRTARLRGTARTLPCRARWDIAGDGPLGWLRGARQLGSVRMADFRMTFG